MADDFGFGRVLAQCGNKEFAPKHGIFSVAQGHSFATFPTCACPNDACPTCAPPTYACSTALPGSRLSDVRLSDGACPTCACPTALVRTCASEPRPKGAVILTPP